MDKFYFDPYQGVISTADSNFILFLTLQGSWVPFVPPDQVTKPEKQESERFVNMLAALR